MRPMALSASRFPESAHGTLMLRGRVAPRNRDQLRGHNVRGAAARILNDGNKPSVLECANSGLYLCLRGAGQGRKGWYRERLCRCLGFLTVYKCDE
jgi:hypothetical protein